MGGVLGGPKGMLAPPFKLLGGGPGPPSSYAYGPCDNHRAVSGGRIRKQILPWGPLFEHTPLGKDMGNLAQAETGTSTQDPFDCNRY